MDRNAGTYSQIPLCSVEQIHGALKTQSGFDLSHLGSSSVPMDGVRHDLSHPFTDAHDRANLRTRALDILLYGMQHVVTAVAPNEVVAVRVDKLVTVR